MKAFDKIKVAIAKNKPIHIDLSCSHVTTSDFMQLGVPYMRRLIPGQSLDIDVNAFGRLAPMQLPTFGDAVLNLRAFFVPYAKVWKGWNDFYSDVPHAFASGASPALLTRVPYVSNSTLITLLSSTAYAESVASTVPHDFEYVSTPPESSSPVTTYYRFKPLGRLLYKLLRQLGYAPMFDLDAANSSGYQSLNALDLLCLLKVYYDHYYPSEYLSSSEALNIASILNRDVANYQLSISDMSNIATFLLYVCYGKDYFTAAFDNPSGPNVVNSTYRIDDVEAVKTSISGTTVLSGQYAVGTGSAGYPDGTPTLAGYSGSTGTVTLSTNNISQYALMALRSLSDYLKRHQLAGSSYVDRFLAQYGMKPAEDGRCAYLGHHKVPLMVADVMATSDSPQTSTQTSLGGYAGKGYLNGNNGHFKVNSGSEFGTFFIVSTIQPKVCYYQGYDYDTVKLTRLSFYQPEFDGLGTRAIERGELYMPYNTGVLARGEVRKVFGFTPQYAEYKIPYSRLTGDFNLDSMSAAGFTSQAWHLYRKVQPTTMQNLVHNKSFIQSTDSSQYNRIFMSTTTAADHFVLNYLFRVKSTIPCRALMDSYDFEHDEHGDVVIQSGGQRVN